MPKLTFDPEGLHRAVLNVVSNAIDACDREAHRPRAWKPTTRTPNRRRIDPTEPSSGMSRSDVVYDPADSLVQVRVDDNGGGIPPEEHEHIFSLFVSNKGNRGTGLGLAGESEDHARARRPDPRRERAGPRRDVHSAKCPPCWPT